MSPEHRTPTPFGPLLRGKRKKLGGLASVAVLVAIGLVTPAAAIAHTMTSNGGVTSVADDDKCDKYGLQALGKCKKPKPKPTGTPTPPPPPTGCNDIDSAVQGMTKYVSVVCSGEVRVLSVNEAGPNPPTPVAGPEGNFWQLVGGPTNVFEATLAVEDAHLLVTVLTSEGDVVQGVCDSTLPLDVESCEFHDMPTPPNE
ncbi:MULTISPECIES: hypothetical protein [unclassified Streptomyces]|uniref:hypothetical protein n=1 Tax=unclassified Streptomyces TaxID=2593676 RepID=UPI002E80E88D|nr:hypothetical protein [Streptomyces sp. NBC_00562]WUC20701.1 hypothetical protein OHA33_18505 [Streptomyces sp. NBC_00562]